MKLNASKDEARSLGRMKEKGARLAEEVGRLVESVDWCHRDGQGSLNVQYSSSGRNHLYSEGLIHC